MRLYLLRHADANTFAARDDERPLSDKGFTQAERIGRFCHKHDIQPEVILTSPLLRTQQTAEHVAKELKSIKVEVAPFLASGMDPDSAFAGLQPYKNFGSVMIVGHQPDIAELIARLIAVRNHAHIHISKGSLSSLDVHALASGGAILEFSIPCRLM